MRRPIVLALSVHYKRASQRPLFRRMIKLSVAIGGQIDSSKLFVIIGQIIPQTVNDE